MAEPTSTLPSRVPELDGIRGLAIVMVLLYHYVAVAIPPDASPGLQFMRQIFSKNWSGVDLFFVLSGFLITGILIDKKAATNYFRVFYIRRICRIFPLYYFFLATFFVLRFLESRYGFFSNGIFANPLPDLPYFFYLQNLAMAIQGTFGNEFLAITWSLVIEEHFYLILPLIVWRSSPQRLPLNILLLISLSLILRATVAGGSFAAFVLIPWRLDGLFLGSLLAILVRTPFLLERVRARLSWVKLASGALFLFILYSTLTEPLGSLNHLFIFGLFFASIIFLSTVETTNPLARFFRQPLLINLGRISYGIYLFHQMVNGIVHDIFFKQVPRFDSISTIAATIFAFVLLFLIARGIYHTFEKRFIEFGHRYPYTQDEVPEAAVTRQLSFLD